MPIDPSISLQVQTPPPIDVAKPIMNALTMRAMQQEQQLRGQQIQGATLENQQRQRELNFNQVFANAVRSNAKPQPGGAPTMDWDGVLNTVTSAGYGPEGLKLSAAHKADVAATLAQEKAAIELHTAAATRFSQLGGSVISAIDAGGDDPVKQQHGFEIALPQAVQQAVSENLLTPDHAQQMLEMKYSPDTRQQIQDWVNQGQSLRDSLANEKANLDNFSAKLLQPSVIAEGQSKASLSVLQLASQTVPDEKELAKDPNVLTSWSKRFDPQTQATLAPLIAKGDIAGIRKLGMPPEQQAVLPGNIAKSNEQVAQDVSSSLRAAALTGDPDKYTAAWGSVYAQNPGVAARFTNPRDYDPAKPQAMASAIDQAAQTSEQRTVTQNLQAQRNTIDAIRQSTAASLVQWRQYNEGTLTGTDGKPITPGQRQAEERYIQSQEYGTSTNPGGLNQRRMQLGSQLAAGTSIDSKTGASTPLTTQQRTSLTNQYNAATEAQQQIQLTSKARLLGIQAPSMAQVKAAKEGELVPGADGSSWHKQGGIVWPGDADGNLKPAVPAAGAQPAQTPAPAGAAQVQQPAPAAPQPRQTPAPTPRPAASSPPPDAASTMLTEAQARQKATDAGKDPDWYVAELRKRNLIK